MNQLVDKLTDTALLSSLVGFAVCMVSAPLAPTPVTVVVGLLTALSGLVFFVGFIYLIWTE